MKLLQQYFQPSRVIYYYQLHIEHSMSRLILLVWLQWLQPCMRNQKLTLKHELTVSMSGLQQCCGIVSDRQQAC